MWSTKPVSYTHLLSRYLGDDEETVLKMYLAGALHDIGKAAIGNDILEKPGRLTDEEFSKMKNHAGYTYPVSYTHLFPWSNIFRIASGYFIWDIS